MKTTRRRLLSLIGLGAAAAALAPVTAVQAAVAPCHQCQPDSPFPHVYGHGVGVAGGALLLPPDETRDDTAYIQGMIDQAMATGTVATFTGSEYTIGKTVDATGVAVSFIGCTLHRLPGHAGPMVKWAGASVGASV